MIDRSRSISIDRSTFLVPRRRETMVDRSIDFDRSIDRSIDRSLCVCRRRISAPSSFLSLGKLVFGDWARRGQQRLRLKRAWFEGPALGGRSGRQMAVEKLLEVKFRVVTIWRYWTYLCQVGRWSIVGVGERARMLPSSFLLLVFRCIVFRDDSAAASSPSTPTTRRAYVCPVPVTTPRLLLRRPHRRHDARTCVPCLLRLRGCFFAVHTDDTPRRTCVPCVVALSRPPQVGEIRAARCFRKIHSAAEEKRKLMKEARRARGKKKRQLYGQLAELEEHTPTLPTLPPIDVAPFGHNLPAEVKELCAPLQPFFEQKMMPKYTAVAWMRYWRNGPTVIAKLKV